MSCCCTACPCWYFTLKAAKDALVEVEIVETNKTALLIAVDMAEAVTQEQLDKVVLVVANEFKAALENAQTVYADASATQAEVDEAFDRLASVMHMLDFFKGDKAALQKMMDQIGICLFLLFQLLPEHLLQLLINLPYYLLLLALHLL